MGILDGAKQHEEPFHSGEVFHLWSFLYDTKATLVCLQIYSNHCGDHDLKTFIEDLIESCYQQEEQQVEGILKESGIRLPPAPPDRPNVEVQDIPAGARFNDSEIARQVQKEIVMNRMLCSYIIWIAIREDIASLFNDFHTQKVEYEGQLLKITKDKGWAVPPPINIK